MRRSAEATTARRLAGVLWVTLGVLSFISYFVHDASWFFYAFLVPALVAWALAATSSCTSVRSAIGLDCGDAEHRIAQSRAISTAYPVMRVKLVGSHETVAR
jgi:hypothetical protein